MMTRHLRRRLFSINVAAALVLASACAGPQGWGGPPRIVLGTDDLARLLQRQFPQERRLLEVLDVTLRSELVKI